MTEWWRGGAGAMEGGKGGRRGLGAGLGEIPAASAGMTEVGRGCDEKRGRANPRKPGGAAGVRGGVRVGALG